MAGQTKAQLEARLAQLEADNEQLRARLESTEAERAAATAPPGAAPPGGPVTATPAAPPRARGRAFVAVVIIVLGTILAPVGTFAAFSAAKVSTTEAFVNTLAPLAQEPAIQALIVDEASVAIDQALDTEVLIADLLDGIVDANDRPRLAAATERLGPLLADQARTAIRSGVTRVVESDAFADAWEESLRLTHAQLVSVLEGEGGGAVEIDDAGVVTIELQPLIERLKPALVDAGISIAAQIPAVDVSIQVAEVPSIAQARLAYDVLLVVGAVLPWVAIALIVIGVAMHPRSARAAVLAGTLVLVTGAVLAGAIALGGSIAATMVATQVPTAATDAIYTALTAEVAAVMLAYMVLGAVTIVLGLYSGRSLAAMRARSSVNGLLGHGGDALVRRRWLSAGFSAALRRQGWILWVVLAAVFVVLGATLRPLSASDVLWSTLLLIAIAALYAVLRGTGARDQHSPAGQAVLTDDDADAVERDPTAAI